VLTKSDLVDEELLDLSRMEVAELVAGSFSRRSRGSGELDHRQRSGRVARELARAAAAVPEKNSAGYFRLPIDACLR